MEVAAVTALMQQRMVFQQLLAFSWQMAGHRKSCNVNLSKAAPPQCWYKSITKPACPSGDEQLGTAEHTSAGDGVNLTCVDSAEISTALEPPFSFAVWSSCMAGHMQCYDSYQAQRVLTLVAVLPVCAVFLEAAKAAVRNKWQQQCTALPLPCTHAAIAGRRSPGTMPDSHLLLPLAKGEPTDQFPAHVLDACRSQA